MSATTTPTTVASAISGASGNTHAQAVASLVDNLTTAARRGASGVPEAAHEIAQLDPDLADKAAVQSKTLWGIIAVQLVTAAVHHYNLGWAPDVITEVAGLIVLVVLRLKTSAPITAWFKA